MNSKYEKHFSALHICFANRFPHNRISMFLCHSSELSSSLHTVHRQPEGKLWGGEGREKEANLLRDFLQIINITWHIHTDS